jgi:hypothetical protein
VGVGVADIKKQKHPLWSNPVFKTWELENGKGRSWAPNR